jgi:hypothetical protein
MTFKIIATVVVVAIAAGASCGCSTLPPGFQAQNAFGSAGRVTPAQSTYAATSPTVEVPGDRVVGADPDTNVRFDLNRDAGFHLHGGN